MSMYQDGNPVTAGCHPDTSVALRIIRRVVRSPHLTTSMTRKSCRVRGPDSTIMTISSRSGSDQREKPDILTARGVGFLVRSAHYGTRPTIE